MFTGLVQAVGRLTLTRSGAGAALRVEHPFGALAAGESVAVNGVCLTVSSQEGTAFRAHASSETLARTSLGSAGSGAVRVNLERALCVGDRLGGHWVSGHVDTVVRVAAVAAAGEARRVTFSLPAELSAFVAPKGSVALDGVSLTVNEIREAEFSVMLVPHTLAVTTLSELAPGALVNLEVDLLARYAVRALTLRRDEDPERAARLEQLLETAGFTEPRPRP